jgi:predicted nucleotidyltransferase
VAYLPNTDPEQLAEHLMASANSDGGAIVKGAFAMFTNLNETEATEKMTRRIVEQFHPQRLILFGSRARGEARRDSDFDLLIIAPSNEPRWQRAVPVYRALAGLGVPKDIVWWTPDEVAAWQDVKSHFITTALREGRVLHEERT